MQAKILFVDDEDMGVLSYTKRLRAEYPDGLTKVRTATEAREEIAKEPFPYDLVILDVYIRPGPTESAMDAEYQRAGLHLLALIRGRGLPVPVIILTNNFDQLPLYELRADKQTKSLDKTFTTPQQLIEEVNRSLGRKGWVASRGR